MPEERITKIADGLSRLAMVLRAREWAAASERSLTPLQGHVLALALESRTPLRLGELSRALGVKAPTASKAVSTLVDKELVVKRPDPEDARAIALHLTAKGRREARRAARWPERITDAIAALDEEEQRTMLRALVKMIRGLQRNGEISAARTCVDCRFFEPDVYEDELEPHHCGFVDAPFGDGELQVHCADHEATDERSAAENWKRFLRVVS